VQWIKLEVPSSAFTAEVRIKAALKASPLRRIVLVYVLKILRDNACIIDAHVCPSSAPTTAVLQVVLVLVWFESDAPASPRWTPNNRN
jgi:hypothetical protein